MSSVTGPAPVDKTFLTGVLDDQQQQQASSSSSSLVAAGGGHDALAAEQHDYDRYSQITRLHQKMREMKAMDEQLTAMQQDHANRLRLAAEGEARFLEKQRHTIAYLTRFRGYIQDADAKRARAEKKIEEERRAIEDKTNELEVLRARLAALTKSLEAKQRRLEHHRQYRQYLESVVLVADQQFGEVSEMLARHASLAATNTDLQRRLDELRAEAAGVTAQRQALRKEKQTELLVANSLLARLLKGLEGAAGDAQKGAQAATAVARSATGDARLAGEIAMSIKNLYQRATVAYPVVLTVPQRPLKVRPPPPAPAPTGDAAADAAAADAHAAALLAHLSELLGRVTETIADAEYIVSELNNGPANGGAQSAVVGPLASTPVVTVASRAPLAGSASAADLHGSGSATQGSAYGSGSGSAAGSSGANSSGSEQRRRVKSAHAPTAAASASSSVAATVAAGRTGARPAATPTSSAGGARRVHALSAVNASAIGRAGALSGK